VQMYPNQSTDSPMIAVMNSVVSPEQIRQWQDHLNGHRILDISNKQGHPYRGLTFLAVFGSHFHHMYHTPWFDAFLIDGYQRSVHCISVGGSGKKGWVSNQSTGKQQNKVHTVIIVDNVSLIVSYLWMYECVDLFYVVQARFAMETA
jgi:hypothetical protein